MMRNGGCNKPQRKTGRAHGEGWPGMEKVWTTQLTVLWCRVTQANFAKHTVFSRAQVTQASQWNKQIKCLTQASTHSSLFQNVFKILFLFHVYRCLPASMPAHYWAHCPWKGEDDVRSSGAGVPDGWEPSHGWWDLNSGPVEEHTVFLIAEPSLQLLWLFLKYPNRKLLWLATLST